MRTIRRRSACRRSEHDAARGVEPSRTRTLHELEEPPLVLVDERELLRFEAPEELVPGDRLQELLPRVPAGQVETQHALVLAGRAADHGGMPAAPLDPAPDRRVIGRSMSRHDALRARRRPSAARFAAVLMSDTCVNACGKLPTSRPWRVSYSSERRPTSLRSASSRSKR